VDSEQDRQYASTTTTCSPIEVKKLPYNVEYKDDDLNDEKTLERALQLLYAARLGESGLRARPSIHINYDYLQSELDEEAKLRY